MRTRRTNKAYLPRVLHLCGYVPCRAACGFTYIAKTRTYCRQAHVRVLRQLEYRQDVHGLLRRLI